MSHSHPHGFPDETPEPTAEPYTAAARLLDLTFIWAGVAVAIGSVCVIAYSIFH
jgi:hypothetical protein